MIGKNQLQNRPARIEHLGGVGDDVHPFGYRQGARGLQLAVFGILDQAHAARADLVDVLKVAQSGDFDAGQERSFQNGAVLFYLNFPAIDLECYHVSKSFLIYGFPVRKTGGMQMDKDIEMYIPLHVKRLAWNRGFVK
ncbi:hypothetical protein SDC9_110388 [bioreactor metagenome]|uniref:Uncharacterized protein n=1 Tax=bioreactor metagenome TaxID=1076179 RepID=A0A645BEM5_9ZZZZ